MSVCPSPPVVSPPMRVSGEMTTADLPMRPACTAAEIAAGLEPYITMSRSSISAARAPLAANMAATPSKIIVRAFMV